VPKQFKISRTVSNKSWGDIDKTALRGMLVQGLEEGVEGVREAIREVYAVIRGDDIKDAPSQNWVMPHHEVHEDGTVVLNRDGLAAAAAAYAGARSETDLTGQQREVAREHLARHYRELGMPLPPGLGGQGEMASVMAALTGEIRVEDIPLAPWVDLAAIKAGDPDPLEVVVEVPAGKSTRGWNYLPKALQRIVGEVMRQGLPGFLGHQKPEEVDYQFPLPVTHWVGAKWENGKAYFRGVIDRAAADLKRWIRAKTVRTVSIFGLPTLQRVAGETHVIDFKPLSIDWTPLGRAGMPTAIVAMGEIDVIKNLEGGQKMTWKELVAQLKTMLASGEVTRAQVVGEMGWKAADLAGELDAKWFQETKDNAEMLNKVREALGITGEMDLVARANEAFAALEEKKKAAQAELIDQVVKEKVSGEMAQSLVKKMLAVPEGATKEQIAGEIDKVINDQAVKDALSKLHIDRPAFVMQKGKESDGMLVSRKVRI